MQFLVTRFQIIGTSQIVYEALEPAPTLLGGHSSTTSFHDDRFPGRWGKIDSRPLPAELDALPCMTQERSDAVSAWRNEQVDEALGLILLAFPHLLDNPNVAISDWRGEITETFNSRDEATAEMARLDKFVVI